MTATSTRRFLLMAEGNFGPMTSKTANAFIRYSPDECVAVLDSTSSAHTVQEVLGFGGSIPIVRSIDEAMQRSPTAMLIGIAPAGGQFPAAWRNVVTTMLEAGHDIWSGLHTMIGDDPEFAAIAARSGATIRDLRRPPENLDVSYGRVRDISATVVLTVGTDCNIGKMTSQLQIQSAVRALGHRVNFAPTGQTGILIEGRGIAVDAVIADFISGAAERLTIEAAEDADIVLVEGQGSLLHPAYSGVTLGLIHGSLPHAMVLCAQPTRLTIHRNPWVTIPPLDEVIRLHESITRALRPSPVIAISLNTYDMSDEAARDAVDRVHRETGLPVTDPVRFDPAPIAQAVSAFHRERVQH